MEHDQLGGADAQLLTQHGTTGGPDFLGDLANLIMNDLTAADATMPNLTSHDVMSSLEYVLNPDGSNPTDVQLEASMTGPDGTNLADGFANHVNFLPTQSKVRAFFSFWAAKQFLPINQQAVKLLSPSSQTIVDARALKPGVNFQGISFDALGVRLEDVEHYRRMVFRRTLNNPYYGLRFRKNKEKDFVPARKLPTGDVSHFRFRQMNMKYKPVVPHFQLRHTLSASSKNAVFYSVGRDAFCYSPEADTQRRVFRVKDSASTPIGPLRQGIGCLQAKHDLLCTGDEQGHYSMKSLSGTYSEPAQTGVICDGSPVVRMTNHVALNLHRRSGLPQATFCPNDNTLRTMDCCTTQFVHKHTVDWPVNCTAISPDGRLRLAVGDGCQPLLMDAEKGSVIFWLPNHDDYGFACDWADNGIQMATGNQDGKTQIWDCRRLSQPLHVISAEITAVRTLQFSPVGSGRRLLVMAEDVDSISIVDATTFETQQRFGVLGEITGISLVPDGDKLFVGVADGGFGGIAEFDRCDFGYDRHDREIYHTWAPDEELGDEYPVGILDPSCYQDWSPAGHQGFVRSGIR